MDAFEKHSIDRLIKRSNNMFSVCCPVKPKVIASVMSTAMHIVSMSTGYH